MNQKMNQTNQQRATKLILILGFNGTGKTTLLKKLVLNELKKPDSHILIVTPDDLEWYNIPDVWEKRPERVSRYVGARKLIYYDGCLKTIQENFRSGLLIFDDCRAYLTANTEMDLHNLFIRRRQKGIDIIAVGHGFTEVPPKFFTFASDLILFRTMDNIERRRQVIRNYDEVEAAQLRINEKALSNPYENEIIKMV